MNDAERQRHESYWVQSAAFWRRYDEMEARLTRPVSERMLELAGISPGMRVLDVASGRGEPALPAAHRVGPHGWVLAVDLAEPMLQIARERARREGLENVGFQVADAEALQVGEQSFDVATLRWGLMYMPSPERALASIHRALKPGGALALASWADPARVAFATLPRQVLQRYRDVPPLKLDGPSVFRHADRATLDAALLQAGFCLEASEELEVPVVEAADGRAMLSWFRELGGAVMKLADELPPLQREAWEEELCAELEKHRAGEKLLLGGVTRLTLARRPARQPSTPVHERGR